MFPLDIGTGGSPGMLTLADGGEDTGAVRGRDSAATSEVTGGIKGHPYIWHSHSLSHYTWKALDAPSGEEKVEAREGQRFDHSL